MRGGDGTVSKIRALGFCKSCTQHPDRGSQYCSDEYQRLLKNYGFLTSMSGKGCCFDNVAVKIFFKTLKAEPIWHHAWLTRRACEIAIFQYINGFYNPRRKHSGLNWESPLAFERMAA
jgi:transposase InsO family protein